MRTVIARIFDYSLDGVIAAEGTSFFDFCRDLPPVGRRGSGLAELLADRC